MKSYSYILFPALLAALATPLPATSTASPSSAIDLTKSPSGPWNCEAQAPLMATDSLAIRVEIKGLHDPKTVHLSGQYMGASGTIQSIALVANPANNLWSADLKLSATKMPAVALDGSIDGAAVNNCAILWNPAAVEAVETTPGTAAPNAPAPPVTTNSITLSHDDACAESYLARKEGVDALQRLHSQHPRDTVLLQLPSGSAAAENPTSLSERVRMLVAAIVPYDTKSHTLAVTVTQCPTPVAFRLQGDFMAGKDETQAAGDCPGHYEFLLSGSEIICGAGTMTYKSAVDNKDPATSTVTLRPVYNAAAAFLYGFDTAHINTFAATDGKVTESFDKSGTSLLLGFTWYVLGLDPDNMDWSSHWYNRVFNLFGVVDPKAAADGFAVGLSIIPGPPGISFALGASFHKQTVLNGLKVGDAFTGTGAVPTTTKWSGKPGFLFGVVLDSTAFGILKKAWSGTQSGSSPSTPTGGDGGQAPANKKPGG